LEAEPPVLRVRGLRRIHPPRRRGAAPVVALHGVDLDVRRGRTLAIVGRSGAGKSTLARCLARLEDAEGGEIFFEERDVVSLRGAELRAFRERVQLVQQDSAAALDPLFAAEDIVREPLDVLRRGSRAARARRVGELIEAVGLERAHAARRPAELSGGQRQRLAIARALAVEPRVLILDEAFAGLDVTVQAGILSLLAELRGRLDLTLVVVSHDLALMASLADDVAVIAAGRVVEAGDTAAVLAAPRDVETRALLDAVVRVPALEAARA
jgi:peptide/nickel transport system ATP-binding protein